MSTRCLQYEIGKFACECPVVIFVNAVGLRTIFNSVTLYECLRNRLIEFACAIEMVTLHCMVSGYWHSILLYIFSSNLVFGHVSGNSNITRFLFSTVLEGARASTGL